jgi:class III poly(R)-hydroxyalkanoic acid synthase PhaC subunit
LRHYYPIVEKTNRTPLLIVYAFINRHYILDLLPQISVVRSLLGGGFDIFATDWGTPSAYDKEFNIGYFVNNYMDKSVDLIREHTKSDKVSLLGYCWGGDLALIYAALHPEKIKNIITVATPGDFDADDGLLSLWTKNLDVDAVLDAFGNVPSALLNTAFALRSPIDYLHKYPHFFEELRDLQSVMEFFATQMWLYDSPPVIGEIYRQFVKDCYQQNLLIKNQMQVEATPVNLKNIKAPFLNVVASKDDLVAPESSKALNDAIGSADKNLMEFQSGHVGLLISSRAHQELWPKVAGWLKEHS